MSTSGSVLVVEDDAQVASTIAGALERDGWRTETVMSLAEARERLEASRPRILVVDIGLPDGSGMAFVREAAGQPDLGIVVVTGRSEEVDRVVGLELGADDYVTKPFSLREMTARVRALSRRMDNRGAGPAATPAAAADAGPSGWQIGDVMLDPLRLKVVAADGTEVRLTGGEAGLLKLLLEAPDRTAERETIAERVLGHRLMPHQRGVDQLASMLRRKLAAASEQRIQVLALRGRGYRLVA
ncbi:response regulator transcription factor [Roseomonas sp. AR75]|jgi:DNA-binding response OmpR family regulator|uniref:response regulator transcription factor n=1 Tax=Roseomonas sp. AR75 TaxID=2562311 RepID=UPI0010C0FB16|nr:response regulator transcription factor [Roseomonas sp. AR75]